MDSGRSGGQWEELRTSGDIKKGSIHYLKGLSLLKKVVLYIRGGLQYFSLFKRVVFTKKGCLHIRVILIKLFKMVVFTIKNCLSYMGSCTKSFAKFFFCTRIVRGQREVHED